MNIPSTCPHFSKCSGCVLGNLSNPPIWKEAAAFFQENGVAPTLEIDGFSGVRYKAKLAVRKGPKIGLFERNTHNEPIAKPLLRRGFVI